jgi:hypothetical protein
MNIVLRRTCFCETLILLRKPEEVNLLQASSSNDNECDRECRICWYTMYISFWYNIIQLLLPLKVNIIIVHPWDVVFPRAIIIVHPRGVVFPRALARGKTTSQGWTIMMFTASAGNKPEGKQHPKGEQLWCSPQVRAIIVLLYRNSIYNNVGCNKHLFVCFYLVFS